jgi:hypothetical protein
MVLLTCDAPKCEGDGVHLECEPRCRAFPKRKARSIPSIRAVSWQCSLYPRTKIEHISPDSRPFEGAFSGIDCA